MVTRRDGTTYRTSCKNVREGKGVRSSCEIERGRGVVVLCGDILLNIVKKLQVGWYELEDSIPKSTKFAIE